MDWSDAPAIIVALIAALAAWASQRSAAKASEKTARSAAEEEAYSRARALDTETISRLEADNTHLRNEMKAMRDDFTEREDELLAQIEALKRRIRHLEETAT